METFITIITVLGLLSIVVWNTSFIVQTVKEHRK